MLPNRVGCASAFDSFRRYLKHPAKNKRNRQTENDEQNNQSNDPVRNVEDRKNLRDALREGPTRDDVRDRNLVNIAPLQLGEEIAWIHIWPVIGRLIVQKAEQSPDLGALALHSCCAAPNQLSQSHGDGPSSY